MVSVDVVRCGMDALGSLTRSQYVSVDVRSMEMRRGSEIMVEVSVDVSTVRQKTLARFGHGCSGITDEVSVDFITVRAWML